MEEAPKAAENNLYGELTAYVNREMDDLQNMDVSSLELKDEAEELLELPDCVHIFFVSADGRVSSFSEPLTLRIFRLKDGVPGDTQGGTFIQVGGWTHPLIPGISPVLRAENGAFVFPDVYGNDKSSVGLVITDETPFNNEGEAELALAQALMELAALKTDKEPQQKGPPSLSETDPYLGKIGKFLVKNAELVNKGIQKGTAKALELIEEASEKQKAKTLGEEQSGKTAKVNPVLKVAAKGALKTTKVTVKVSGFVANRVGKLTKMVADDLARRLEKPVVAASTAATGGTAALKSSGSMHTLVDAARGGLLAYGTVYSGLEDAAKAIGTSIKSNSVHIIKQQYGEEAGSTYDNTLTAAGNAAMTYMNIQSLGVKGMLKTTAKHTGKNIGKAVIDAHLDPDKKNLDQDATAPKN